MKQYLPFNELIRVKSEFDKIAHYFFFYYLSVAEPVLEARRENANVHALIESYRLHGHRVATVNPIDYVAKTEIVPELETSRYGLSDSQQKISITSLVGFDHTSINTVGDLKSKLNEVYCQNVSAEFGFIENEYERQWFAENYEKLCEQKPLITVEEKRSLAKELLEFQEFDRFMNAKLPQIKRYGGEGCESILNFFRILFRSAGEADVSNVVLGMPHRGKLNSLVTIFNQRPVKILRKYRGLPEFGDDAKAMMDIPNHFSELLLMQVCRDLKPKISF
jgi:probable 2-oxoglutarate dehydrogenase E1 component DHKTD1